MTGSPVLKVNLDTNKKQVIQRKLSFLQDDDAVKASQPASNCESAPAPDRRKSVASSLSSHVFAQKRGVKRKLDFDAYDASDGENSFRFSNRNISLGGFQSRNSSLADITLSPNKNRVIHGSYSRSSVGSTCRRRLFADGAEPQAKRSKLEEESPLLRSKTNSKKIEVKLSLKKKFPGVPNSDSARSGLLLNLAFSKYNLSSNKERKDNISYDFGDDSTVNATTKKDFVHYSSIKKDDSSHCHSPVFMAIKKVKRRLNLEEQESAPATVAVQHTQVVEVQSGGDETVKQSEAQSAIVETIEEPVLNSTMEKSGEGTELAKGTSHTTPDTHLFKQRNTIFEGGENDTSQVVSSPPLVAKSHPNRQLKNDLDLFKNSKLRSSLRNKIFNLSKCPNSSSNSSKDNCNLDKTAASASDAHCTSPVLDRKRRQSSSHPRKSLAGIFDSAKNKQNIVKYDRIVVKRDLVERTKKDSERLKRLSSGTSFHASANRPARKKWINESFDKDANKPTRCNRTSKYRGSFIESHLQRFLNDCLNAAEHLNEAENSLGVDLSQDQLPKSVEHVSSQSDVRPEPEQMKLDDNEQVEVGPIATPPKLDPVIEEYLVEEEASPVAQVEVATEFIIEDATSQEINQQCVEEVELVIVNSTDSPECDTNCRSVGFKKKCRIFEETFDQQTQEAEEILFESASEVDDGTQQRYLVEEISTQGSTAVVQANEGADSHTTPSKTSGFPTEDRTFTSTKKKKRKRLDSNTLSSRLSILINREKSEMRMWEYERSQKLISSNGHGVNSPAVFCVEKMWREFSRLILVCSVVNQEVPGKLYDLNEMKNVGIGFSNSVVIIMESDFCPKTLTFSSIFQVHPPWRILCSEKSDPAIILRPCKVEVLSENGNPLLYRDPTLPIESLVISEKQFCSCIDFSCNCQISDGYQTVITALLFPVLNLSHRTIYPELKTYTEEDLQQASGLDDVILKHKLYSSEFLFIDLRILHVHKDSIHNDFGFWYIICVNEKREVCCIVIEGEMTKNLPCINTEIRFRFSGVVPWNFVPAQCVPKFIELVKLTDSCDISEQILTTGLNVFVLSHKHGKIERL